jgi:hypothetical protein
MNAFTWQLLRPIIFGVMALIVMLTGSMSYPQVAGKDFDHLRTGFALSGAHNLAKCESCHVNGVFKGTPRDCASCHTSGLRLARNNVVKPPQHIPTQVACDTCHTVKSFAGAKFNHAGVTTDLLDKNSKSTVTY